MTQVLSCENENSLHGKIKEVLQKTEEYVEMNKLSLNTTKTKLIIFSHDNSDFGSIFFIKTKFATQKCCRYFGIQIDRNLNFDEQLNETLKKMAHAIRSIY